MYKGSPRIGLTKKDVMFRWGVAEVDAIQAINKMLVSPRLVLKYPDGSQHIIPYTDFRHIRRCTRIHASDKYSEDYQTSHHRSVSHITQICETAASVKAHAHGRTVSAESLGEVGTGTHGRTEPTNAGRSWLSALTL